MKVVPGVTFLLQHGKVSINNVFVKKKNLWK